MKTHSRKIAPWMAALLCLTLAPGTKATDETDAPKAPTSQKSNSEPNLSEQDAERCMGSPCSALETSAETKSNEGGLAKANKASSILGMDVRNQNDEHLGHIKDIVIDWKTEQVSYAVISTAPKAALGIGEKLLAVPLAALTVSSDQKHLTLNADKSKVAAAMGFDRNNWPGVSNPSWGAEPFWQKETSKPGVTDEPATEPEAAAKPDALPPMPEAPPEMKPSQDPESPPDMEQESKPDMDPDGN